MRKEQRVARQINTTKTNKLQLRHRLMAVYTAGLIDGEGYIGIIKTHNPSKDRFGNFCLRTTFTLRVEIQMTHKETIDWFQKTFNCRPVSKIIKENGNHAYRTAAAANKALSLLRFIYPYLRTKKVQAALGIKFQSRRAKNHLRYVLDQDVEMEIRDRFYRQIRKLNTMKGGVSKEYKAGLHIHPRTALRQ